MNENEAKAREALKVWKQEKAWNHWLVSPDVQLEPELPDPRVRDNAINTLAAFAAEILERNP